MPPEIDMHNPSDSQRINAEQTLADLLPQGLVSEAAGELNPSSLTREFYSPEPQGEDAQIMSYHLDSLPTYPNSSTLFTPHQSLPRLTYPLHPTIYHEYLCKDLHQKFLTGQYCNLYLQVPFRQAPIPLHPLVAMRSPYLYNKLSNIDPVPSFANPVKLIVNDFNDPNINEESLGICLSHLYIDQTHQVTGLNGHTILAAAYALQLSELCDLAVEMICTNFSIDNIIDYLQWMAQSDKYVGYIDQIRTRADNFLLQELPAKLQAYTEIDTPGPGYNQLRDFLVRLPFDKLKYTLENPRLGVPSGIMRVHLAQDVVTQWNNANRDREQAVVITGFEGGHAIIIHKMNMRRPRRI